METGTDLYRQGILRVFPDAMEHKDFIRKVGRYMQEELHIPPGTDVLAGNSICSDDLNQIQFPNLGNDLGGPFNLGGLTGLPFTGITGQNAFLHHKPDNSHYVVIFYGPHVGASFNGTAVTFGSVRRIGQAKPSNCCGALVAALKRIEGINAPVPIKLNDYQFDHITNLLFRKKAELDLIRDTQGKILKATDIVYDFIQKRIKKYLEIAHVPEGVTVILIGGVIINVDDDPSISAYFDKRKMTTFGHDAAGRKETNIIRKFSAWAEGKE